MIELIGASLDFIINWSVIAGALMLFGLYDIAVIIIGMMFVAVFVGIIPNIIRDI